MNPRASSLAAALFAALATSFLVDPVLAQTTAERQCRDKIAQLSSGYAQRVLKAIDRCHRRRSSGVLAARVDCNDLAQADPSGRLNARRIKFQVAIASLDSPCAQAPAVLAQFARCPSPAASVDDGATSDGIDTFEELARCLIGLSEELGEQASLRALGGPVGRLPTQRRGCQKTIGKALRRVISTYAAARSRCMADRDLHGLGLAYGCSGSDEDGSIAKAVARAHESILKHCDVDDDQSLPLPFELDTLGACGDTPEQLGSCVIDVVASQLGSGLIAAAYELPSSCRAGSIVRISNAGVGSRLTPSSFSGGWNGIGHDIDLTDRFRDAMTLDCDPDCANCQLGLDALDEEPHAYCRCAADATKVCDTVGGPDADDCGLTNNACECFLGPPVAVSAGGAPACITVRIVEGHGGAIDIGRGHWENTLGLSAVLHLGTDLAAPCPVCEGDAVAADGVRGGTCTTGQRSGQACDTSAVQPTFGPSSYDCPPLALTNISGEGLGLRIDMTTEPLTLDYTLPCDVPGGLCPCRVCSNDTTLGCHDDSVCAAAAAGTCTAGGGAGVQPNACTNRTCDDGVCTGGPVDRFCDAQVYVDGRGYVACLTDLDCSLLGAGTCTLLDPRRCYDDPITTVGAAGFFGGQAGTVGCLGLTSSAVVNQATGLPGAIRVILDFDAEVRCATDPTQLFEPPGGANCSSVTETTTTTTMPLPLPCSLSVPLVCNGTCPPGQTCQSDGLLACACLP